MKPGKCEWRLRSSLVWLLCLASTITFLLAGITLFFFHLPRITEETRAELRSESDDFALHTETMLGSLQNQLELVATVLDVAPGADLQTVLDRAIAEGGLSALYQIDENGKLIRSAVSRTNATNAQDGLLGDDLSLDRLFLQVRNERRVSWSNKHLSPITGAVGIGVGIPSGRTVLIGEIPLEFVLRTIQAAGGGDTRLLWIFDQHGEILADSENPTRVGGFSLADQPIFSSAIANRRTIEPVRIGGMTYDAATAHSDLLNWYFLTRAPSGLSNPRIVSFFEFIMTALGISILIGLLLAPLWATRMAQPISDIARRARRFADANETEPWPHSRTVELNELSANLENMAAAIHEREQALKVLFEFSPVGILVDAPEQDHVFIRANNAAAQLLGYGVNQLVGKNGAALNLWKDTSIRSRLVADIESGNPAHAEGWLIRKDGSGFLAAIYARKVLLGKLWRIIWVIEDVTERHRHEQEVRELNNQLEARVQQRTELLRLTNDELSGTIERLRLTQDELVRVEKLASLSSLVAGVAHELNTPIGNGVMATSTLRAALKSFREKSAEGMKRSVLESFIEAVDTGSDIALRNLQRAAELVSSFKQVAVDQTSSQRRDFELAEVVGEIAITLHPMLRKSVAVLRLEIPAAIRMDSYPGPLGQVLTNLIANACVHGFSGRETGLITVRAEPLGQDKIRICVEDDGVGIPPDLQPRIFDPFVTTRTGRGGTGLGLHIVHNITVQVLGGSIAVQSEPGKGSRFELTLPAIAPVLKTAPE